VHHLPLAPMSETIVDGYPRQVWWNADGETAIESYSITNMAHGTPIGIGDNDEHYGAQGAFLIEAGISSSYHIANFFGLTTRVHQPKEASEKAPVPARTTELATRRSPPHRPAEQLHALPRRAIDVGSVITRALTAAGLMK
jgi:hypothetical protein